MLFEFEGPVVHGLKNGRKLGFPTANIQVALSEPDGVYVAEARFTPPSEDRTVYKAIVCIGASATFNVAKRTYEVNLLHDFGAEEFYGQVLHVGIHKRLRDNRKFESLDALKA